MSTFDPLAIGRDAEQIDEFVFNDGGTRAAPPDHDDDDGDGDGGGDDGGGDDWDPQDGPFPLMAPDAGGLEPIVGGTGALRGEFPFQVQLFQPHQTPERAQSGHAQVDKAPSNRGDALWEIDTAGSGGGGDDDDPTSTGCILWDIDTAGFFDIVNSGEVPCSEGFDLLI